MGTINGLLGNLDADPVQRGRQFERICKWFLEHDPLYRLQLRRVWLWDEWPGRWAADAGIDLVAQDRTGELWAVQAKAYAPSYAITKRDVDTFLSESGRPDFSFRLLIATTDKIGRTARRTIEGQEKQASVVLLGDLRSRQLDWPSSLTALRAKRPARKKPRPHQRAAVSDVVKGFEACDRGQLVMACGTGKTLASLFIAEQLDATRTLVLLPSLSLLAQTLREWASNARAEFKVLAVCSDGTVADPDAPVASTSGLGLPVTTDPAEIARFLRARTGRRVLFATYQSSPRIADAYRLGRVPALDLTIADEAHRCAGPVSSDFATVLDAGAIRSRRRLFMTATPRYFTGRVIRQAQDADFEAASMDDETTFGPVLHRLSFAEAIDRSLLTDYQVVVVGVDDATYRDWAQRGRFVTLDGTEVTDARTLAGQIGLAKAMRRYDLSRTISFHSRVSRAREFSRTLPAVIDWMPTRQRPKGRLWADYASGEMPAGNRGALLEHLRHLADGERGLLANARCLAEGVDVPTLDGVAFIDPRRSEVDIVQAVGRAIRKAETKKVGTIVIPVFIDTTEDPEVALDSSEFKPVWDVIKALRAHDEILAEQLDELRRELGRTRKRVRLPSTVHVDLPAEIGSDFADALSVRLVERTTASWDEYYGLLLRFIEETGSATPPISTELAGLKLGVWVNNQRALFRKGRLGPRQTSLLGGLPGWSWNPQDEAWGEGFEALGRFVRREGHARVPQGWVEDGYPLGAWVSNQRGFFRRRALSADRAGDLSATPGWVWDTRVAAWEDSFTKLTAFVSESGTAAVPQDYTDPSGFMLGRWVRKQRAAHQRGNLTQDRDRRLAELPGWVWSVPDERWQSAFEALRRHLADHSDTRVLPDVRVAGVNLRQWVQNQRSRRQQLTAEQRSALESLPGWSWAPKEEGWDRALASLLAFSERKGHCQVPRDHIADGVALGAWVATQRSAYRSGQLPERRRIRLEAVPGWSWVPQDESWDTHLAALSDFVDTVGSVVVPDDYAPSGLRLAAWVERQRRLKRRGELGEDRIERLEAISGWIWDPRDTRWEQGFRQLVDWVEEHGSAAPRVKETVNGFRLGHWVSTQRQAHKAGWLRRDRAERLEALPGWTWTGRSDPRNHI